MNRQFVDSWTFSQSGQTTSAFAAILNFCYLTYAAANYHHNNNNDNDDNYDNVSSSWYASPKILEALITIIPLFPDGLKNGEHEYPLHNPGCISDGQDLVHQERHETWCAQKLGTCLPFFSPSGNRNYRYQYLQDFGRSISWTRLIVHLETGIVVINDNDNNYDNGQIHGMLLPKSYKHWWQ